MATRTFSHRFNPAVRLLWRPDRSLQLELGERAVVVTGPAAEALRAVAGRGPGRNLPGPAAAGTGRILDRLGAEGYLWPDDGSADDPEDVRCAPPRPRLAAELAALQAGHGERAAEVLGARRTCSVVISGDGRAGPLVGALLAAAGVGSVHVRGLRTVRLQQALPGGVSPTDEGRPFAAAATDALLRAAPDTDVRPPPPGERADLVVLACDGPLDPNHRAALHAAGQAHLPLRLGPDHGVVGPLVVPGLTSCLRCADLHRLDRDPAWSALAVQLTVPPRTGWVSPVALAATLAGVAAGQVLAYLDGGQPAVIDGTLEQRLPDWRVRRRSWPPHPACECGTSAGP